MAFTPYDCPLGGTYFYDPADSPPGLAGWTVEQFSAADAIITTGTEWRHVQNINAIGGHLERSIMRALPATPDYVELTVALNNIAHHSSDGLDASGIIPYAHLRGLEPAGTDWAWSVGLSFFSQRVNFPQITWRVYLEIRRRTPLATLYSQILLDHELAPGDIPYTFAADFRIKVRQAAANVLEFYVDNALVYTSLAADLLNLTTWNGAVFAQYFFAPLTYQINTGLGDDFRAVKLGPGLPLNCLGPIPTAAEVLTSSTGKISHARISAEHRGEREARFAHEKLGALST